MGVFRRRNQRDSGAGAGVAEFWDWWPQVEVDLADAADAAGAEVPDELAAALTDRVRRIHPDLSWELSTGETGPVLTLSGRGGEESRAMAERWVRAVPAGTRWLFHPARPAEPDALDGQLVLDDGELELSHVGLGLRVEGDHVDATVYHPDFLFMSEEGRAAVAWNVLLLAIGEDDALRYLGHISVAEERPVDALPARALRAVIGQLPGPQSPAWLTGEGRTAHGHPAVVRVRYPLHRVDHLLCDQFVMVSVPYAHAGPERLPVDPSAAALRHFDEALAGLGDDAVLAAHETGDDHRVYYLYADPESGVVGELDQLAAEWQEGRVRITTRNDPGWLALRPLRG